ncbi:MAG: hypothetical protein ACPGTU_05935 [Myxococcota bacterium]
MYDILDTCMPRLPKDKPNHLLGIGSTHICRQTIAIDFNRRNNGINTPELLDSRPRYIP